MVLPFLTAFRLQWLAKDFQRLSNAEFLAYRTVAAIKQTRHSNALKHVLATCYQVEFGQDLSDAREVPSGIGMWANSEERSEV